MNELLFGHPSVMFILMVICIFVHVVCSGIGHSWSIRQFARVRKDMKSAFHSKEPAVDLEQLNPPGKIQAAMIAARLSMFGIFVFMLLGVLGIAFGG